MQCAVCRMIHAASSRDCPCGLEALRREASSSATRRRAGGKGAFCQYQVDKAQGHDLSDALRSSKDLAGVADRVWNCLNLVPGLQALRLYRYPWAACLDNCACISSWQKHIRSTTAPIHLDGHPLHRVRSSHTAQTKTPLRGFFGRESLSEARAHRLESRGDFAVQASKVAHQTAGLEDHVSFPLPEMRVASTLRGAV